MVALNEILDPRSIAVIGASSKPGKWGFEIFRNLLTGKEINVFPVNPQANEILGVKAYESLSSVDGAVDMIVVCVKAEFVPGVVKEAVEKNVKTAVIISSGFREEGRKDLETEIMDIIKGSGLRVIGPNIQGIINAKKSLIPVFNMDLPVVGNVGIISQSGSMSAFLTEKLNTENIGISYLINLGNQIDLCESDFIDFLSLDESTRVMALYMEGPREQERFKKTVEAAGKNKPIILLKPGTSDAGKAVAASHTGSIAGNDAIFSFACRQYGIVRCETATEMLDTVKCFSLLPPLNGKRVMVFSTSGGAGSIAVDELSRQGFEPSMMPGPFLEDLMKKTGVRKGLGAIMDLSESIDDWTRVCSAINSSFENFLDVYFFMIADGLKDIEHVICDVKRNTDKPVVVSYMSDGKYKSETLRKLFENKIVVYETPDRAIRALANKRWYEEFQAG